MSQCCYSPVIEPLTHKWASMVASQFLTWPLQSLEMHHQKVEFDLVRYLLLSSTTSAPLKFHTIYQFEWCPLADEALICSISFPLSLFYPPSLAATLQFVPSTFISLFLYFSSFLYTQHCEQSISPQYKWNSMNKTFLKTRLFVSKTGWPPLSRSQSAGKPRNFCFNKIVRYTS